MGISIPFSCVVLTLLILPVSSLQVYQSKCPVGDSPVVEIGWDDETNEFKLLDHSERSLRDFVTTETVTRDDIDYAPLEDSLDTQPAYAVSLDAIPSRRLQSINETIQARLCSCAATIDYPDTAYFCPVKMTHCSTPWRIYTPQLKPVCITNSPAKRRSSLLWPIVLISFGILLSILFCSIPGRNVIDCCFSHVWPGWNKIVVRCILWRNPARADLMVRRVYLRQRRELEERYLEMISRHPEAARVETETQTESPKRLSLRTKRYNGSKGSESRSPSNQLSEEEEDLSAEHSCMICFVGLTNGERIGDLQCSHIFHVDCLKLWLCRRNVCPLCLRHDIATPLADQDSTTSATPDHDDANV